MANFNLTQFKKQGSAVELIQVPKEPKIASQNTAYTVATLSSIFDDETNLIRLVCDAIAYIVVSGAPVATVSTGTKLLADEVYWFEVEPGSSLRVSLYDGVT